MKSVEGGYHIHNWRIDHDTPAPPNGIRTLFAAALLAVILALPVGPARAQVDWSILGDTGSSACPSGQSEKNATIATFGTGALKKDSVQISTIRLTYSSVSGYAETNIGGGRTIYLEVKGPNGQRVGSRTTLGSVRLTPTTSVPAQTTAVTALTPNTAYTVEVQAVSEVIGRSCFRTAFDLEIPFGSGRGGAGPGDSWSSGCYAFSKDPNQIRACFCGARNASGSWARTDAEDGYKYMMDAAWRQNVGCTTN